MSPRGAAQYVYGLGTYPQSPLIGEWVWVHGHMEEERSNGNEIQYRIKDTKGIWEGYQYAAITPIAPGKCVRGYGQLKAQPDGSVKVALQWIKAIEEKELAYCEKETQTNWEKLVIAFPKLPMLEPFVRKHMEIKLEKKETPKETEKEEFIAANELEIERDYV